jgi:HlyD family secretion protein
VNPRQTIGVIRDSSTLTLKVPFPAENAKDFYIGQLATVTMDGSFEQIAGSISTISETDLPGTGNTTTRSISIEINNPGALSAGQFASANVGGVDSSAAGQLTAKTDRYLSSDVGGDVISISVNEGAWVADGQLILTLGGSGIDKQIQAASEALRNAQLSMQSTRDQLDNYTIKSPISGTIVDKQVKAGDTISGGKLLCTIYDLSYLEVTLQVDELDISDIKVGQTVEVTAEAVPGKSFSGQVTKVSIAGSTISGTTAYPVTIRIDEFEGLLPGMNVDAEIQIAALSQVLAVPNEAVSRGNVVLVTAGSPAAKNAVDGYVAPEGYVFVPVELGISDDDYVEIVSGLSREDVIYYIPDTGGDGNFLLQMMNMRMQQVNGGRP